MSTINSYIRKQALAFLCVFLFCLSMGYSQNLMQSRKEGYLTYVVQLSNVQTKQYVDNPYTFPYEEVLKTVLDSFPSDSTYKRKLIPGNYLFLNAWENTLQVRLQLVCDFEVKAFTDTKGLAVEVLDKNGKNLSDATLNLPKQLIPYSSSRHCYALAKPKEIGSLTVEYGPCISFYRAEENNPYSFWKRRLYKLRYSFPVRLIRRSVYRIGRLFRDRNLDDEEGQPQRKEKAGYMDFSKPKYLPGDTVKFKAYLVNKRGKPLNKPLTLHLQHEYSFEGSKPLLVRTLKPLSPGAYAGSFPLGDTLTLDKNYSIYLLNQKGNTFYFSGRFRYEDYQLDETTYGANLNKSEFTAADTVMLTVSGKDANGLPLLDGHYSISLTRNAIDHIYSDSIYASDTLWIHQGFLENTAETKILIPQTLFPDLKAGYTLRVLFNNSNFESHTEILELTVDKRKEILNLTASDSVITGKARGEQLLGDSYTLTALSPEGDTLLNHPVQVPFREVSNPLAATYILSCKHQDVREEITADKHDPVSVRTHRSKDSVFFQLDNPHRVLVTWAVYRNQHLIQHGQGRDLHWTQPDQSQDSYFLQYSCLWAGRRFEERSSSICFEHNLNIVIHQPETVYPGQEVKMDVQVSDYKGHPAKNVNLTGSSVNSLFKDVRLPAVPYFGKRKKGIPAHKTYELNPVTSSAHALFLSAALRQRMKLDTIAWYKAVYPATGLGMKLDSIGEDWAQFAPFVFRNGIQQQVYAIHIDGKLVYWHIGSIKQPYSFIDWPGWHTVTLRLRDTTFRIDSVRLQNHFKTNLTLDLAKANPHVKFRADTNILSYREGEEVEQNILCLKGLSTGSTYFIRQGTKIVRVDPSAYNAYRGELIYTGPFRPGQELEFIKQDEYTLHFLFESGYSYETRKDLVKMRDLIGAQTNHKLWTGQTLEINFADKALSEKDIEPFSKPAPYNPFVKTYALPTTNKAGNGAFSYRYAGDSLLYAVVMTSLREGNTNEWVFPGYKDVFYDLTPGEYQFYFVTRAGYYLEKKVTIRANAIFCRLIGENPLHKMDSCSIPYSVLSPNRTSTALNTSYSFGNASLEITVRDGKTHELIPFAPVTLRKNKEKVMGVITDMNGIAHFNGLAEGSYEATAMYIGYGSAQEGSVFVRSDRLTKLNLNLLASTLELKSVEIVSYTEPLLMRSMSYSTMASKEMSQYLEVIPGVVSSNSYFFSDADTRSGGTITRDEYTALSSKADTLSKADLGAKGLRNSFSDYAYWVPNLITDEKGEAHFTATFPDNLTTWNSHFAGMDAHKRSGMGIAHTKAMKKVTASLNLPRFLVAGDGYGVQEKILNHTSAVYKLKSSLLLGTTLLEEKDTLLNQSILRYVSIPQASGDSCRLTYTIHLENGYTDGEYRAIPVYPKGVQEKTGIFMPLLHDTLASQSFDASKGPVYLHMTSLPTDLLLSDIEWMKQYPYECNEQKASKLIALLAEQKIKAARKEKFTGDKTIRSLVKKLQDAQNTDGSWGWWGGCNANLWMTTYVTEALYKAFAAGYDVHVTGKAFEYMRWTLAVPGTAHTLYALKVLSECKQGAEYEQILKRIKKDSLGMTDRLLYEKIKQNTGLPIDLSYILSRKKETLMGACYWAGYENGFYDNSTACSIAAYDLLRTDSANRYLCDKLFLYFLEQRSHSGAWRNTVETASLIDLLYPDFLNKQKQEEAKPILLVSSGVRSKSYTHFPFTDTIQVSNLSIQKSGGGNVYFTAYQKSFNPEPEKLSTLFEISTSFTSNKQATETLVPGQPLEMLVDVEVKQKSEFLMLNVPIPAGCTYGPRNNFHEPQESRREQYKDHVAIFCELLTPGHYQFHINLEARYAGTYTLNPAQMESMYFPTLKGRNTCRKVVVK